MAGGGKVRWEEAKVEQQGPKGFEQSMDPRDTSGTARTQGFRAEAVRLSGDHARGVRVEL